MLTYFCGLSIRSAFVAVVVVLGSFTAQVTYAQSPRFTVLLSVPKQNEFTELTRSYIARELRELKDVVLVDRAGQLVISVVPAPVQLSRGSEPARTVAVALSFYLEDGDWMVHDVFIGAPENLRALCAKLVAHFDVGILQVKRSGGRR